MFLLRIFPVLVVGIVQRSNTPGCGPGNRGFKSLYPPQLPLKVIMLPRLASDFSLQFLTSKIVASFYGNFLPILSALFVNPYFW